jgi:hypothetical protein
VAAGAPFLNSADAAGEGPAPSLPILAVLALTSSAVDLSNAAAILSALDRKSPDVLSRPAATLNALDLFASSRVSKTISMRWWPEKAVVLLTLRLMGGLPVGSAAIGGLRFL